MDALTARSTMSRQAPDSERVRDGLKDVLLGPGAALRGSPRAGFSPSAPRMTRHELFASDRPRQGLLTMDYAQCKLCTGFCSLTS